MHYLYFVKLHKDEAKNPREAIQQAEAVLDDNAFTHQVGFWGGGKCDWYIIGGRWSGALSGLGIKGDFHAEVCKLLDAKEPNRELPQEISDEETERHASDIQSLWFALGGKNENPYARGSNKRAGMDDDAIILTPELISALKRKYPDEVEYFDNDIPEERPLSALSEADAGHWLVTVDYHI